MTTLARARSTAAFIVLALVTSLAAAVPATPSGAPLLDAAAVTEAADGVRVVLTGTVRTVDGAIDRVGAAVVARLPLLGAAVVDVEDARLAELEDLPGITVAHNEPVQFEGAKGSTTNDAEGDAAAILGAEKVWEQGYDGSGVGIAVIDTGVSDVTDLAGRVLPGLDLTRDQDGVDHYGHGTPVAAAAAGDGTASGGAWKGVAPGAHIVPVKIADADGRTDIARLLVAMDWVGRNAGRYDIEVVNLSLGSAPVAVDLVDAAVQRLWDLGLVVVVAAGNNGPGTLGTPASNTHAITVGAAQTMATRSPSDDVLASWSATGEDRDGRAKPDVVAPGQSVIVAGAPGSWGYDAHPEGHLGTGYQRVSGTSFSAGLVSGAAALAVDMYPGWSNDEVLGQLVTGSKSVTGSEAPMPWLPRALHTDSPGLGNISTVDGNAGATVGDSTELEALGATPAPLLAAMIGDPAMAMIYGADWYGADWYGYWAGADWYGADWYGADWYGADWYGADWYGADWYGADWYGADWYGADWYGADWYGADWYGADWYGADWYGADWYGADWYGADWYGADWYGADWYGADWYGADWYGADWYGADWYGADWYGADWY